MDSNQRQSWPCAPTRRHGRGHFPTTGAAAVPPLTAASSFPPSTPWLNASFGDKSPIAGLDTPNNVALTEDGLISGDGFYFEPGIVTGVPNTFDCDFQPPTGRPWSIVSSSSALSSGASLSTVQSEESETSTVRTAQSREPSPQNSTTAGTLSVGAAETAFPCDWAGCSSQAIKTFATHSDLVWHVKKEHLLVCPAPGCVEESFGSARMVTAHLAVAHPETPNDKIAVREWRLGPESTENRINLNNAIQSTVPEQQQPASTNKVVARCAETEALTSKKRKCHEQLQNAIEKRSKTWRKPAGSSHEVPRPSAAADPDLPDSQSSEISRSHLSVSQGAPSFPMIWEHAVLPFLIECIPRWSTPRHVISTTRGKSPGLRRINITTQIKLSRSRKMIVARHVLDLLPKAFHDKVSFVFSVGDVVRSTWARGLGRSMPDEVCHPKNPYLFSKPCMGDSIGFKGSDSVEKSTATLGPCLSVDGGSYWLGNFHPFVDAYQSLGTVQIEHPSSQDRAPCIDEAHDSMPADGDYRIGDLMVTSGFNLKTTRVSHDPYWEDMGKDPQLVVTDWALISSSNPSANVLRRFPSDTQANAKEPLVGHASVMVPGATVVCSGRTSGYQRGQICEIPAYVSGEENGTQKATREWFIEEPCTSDDEEGWIRGGIGVEGDSGSPVVDAETHALFGQIWGRNRHWGPGPRHTFFTPIADIFDDIQEKCGQQMRPQLARDHDEADRYPVYPSCRQCYELRTYLDSRRNSRESLQSMIMGHGDGGDQDLTSTEAASELATPRDFMPRGGIEEMGASFNNVLSPGAVLYADASTPLATDVRSPYAQTLELDDVQAAATTSENVRKRSHPSPASHSNSDAKRHRLGQ